jgi:hypothetical protein
MWDPQYLIALLASTACYGFSFLYVLMLLAFWSEKLERKGYMPNRIDRVKQISEEEKEEGKKI